jgi:hypothetical protein
MATTNSQLSVITRRTEPFSPSKCRPQALSHWHNKPIRNLSPNFTSSSSCGPSPSSQPEAIPIPGPFFTSESGSNPIPSQPPVSKFLHALAAPPASTPSASRSGSTDRFRTENRSGLGPVLPGPRTRSF